MTTTSTATCKCGRPTSGATLCTTCTKTIDIALANIAAYYDDLDAVRTGVRATRYDLPKGKGPGRTQPLGMDDRFTPGGVGATALHAARNTVTTWCRVILEEHPNRNGPRRDTVRSACMWLQSHLSVIAAAPWANECRAELLDAERSLKRVDARGPERVYAGLCTVCLIVGDHSPLYAVAGDEYVTCKADDCGAEYRVADRRTLMEDALEYEWMTAARIADLSAYLRILGDREWVRKKLNRWHSDGLLRAASVDTQGRPLFPFGDAKRLLQAADSHRRNRLHATRKGA